MRRQPLVFVIALLLTQAAVANPAPDPTMQKALAKAQFMLRQATTDKAAAEAQIQVVKQELEAQKKQTEEALSHADSKEKKYQDVIAAWKNKYQQMVSVLGDTRNKLGAASQHNQLLSTQLATQVSNFDLCLANNRKLYDINRELLAHYENKSAWDALAQKEPVTGLKKVEVENLIQDYQYRIEDLHLLSSGSTGQIPDEAQEAAK